MHVVNCVPVSVDKGPILTSLKGKGTRLAFSSSCLVMRSLQENKPSREIATREPGQRERLTSHQGSGLSLGCSQPLCSRVTMLA